MPPKRPRGDSNTSAVKSTRQKANEKKRRSLAEKEGEDAECPSTSTPTPTSEEESESDLAELETAILSLLRSRKPGTTSCPSEVPRRMLVGEKGDWRNRMPAVREAAARLVESGQIEITQKGNVVSDPRCFKGPIRLRLVVVGKS